VGRLAVAILAASVAGAALAQPLEESAEGGQAGLRVTVGAGLGWTPKYPGADSYRWRALPVVGVSYGRFFAGGDSGGGGGALGVNLLSDPNWRLGVGLALGFGDARRESDHPSLEGTGDIERTTRGVFFGGYSWRWLSVQLRITPDFGGNDQGTLAFLDVTARYRASERLLLSAGPGVTWADDDYMMTFFGVSAEQAARSNLPVYEARGGVHALRFGINVVYRIGQPWTVGGRLGSARLRGDAEASPITRDRTQNLAAVFVSYRF
jgi:outer membrane protein